MRCRLHRHGSGPKPKPGGPHNKKIRERIKELIGQGKRLIAGGTKKERVISIPGGNKDSRRPDIFMENPDGSPYVEQVGRTDRNGDPVSRERAAIADLQQALGIDIVFTPYDL